MHLSLINSYIISNFILNQIILNIIIIIEKVGLTKIINIL